MSSRYDSAAPGTDESNRTIELFRELATAYSEFAGEAGVGVTAFRDPSLPLFAAKTDLERKKILSALGACVRICERSRAQGNRMGDSPSLVWAALKELGLRPPSDIFAKIDNDTIVEVHTPEGIQIFRNFNFYQFCSYSLEELYCGHWNSLYYRDPIVVQQVLEFLRKIYSREISGMIPLEIPSHSVHETQSLQRFEVELSFKWCAPLFLEGTHTPAGSIVVESARLVRAEREIPVPATQSRLRLLPSAEELPSLS